MSAEDFVHKVTEKAAEIAGELKKEIGELTANPILAAEGDAEIGAAKEKDNSAENAMTASKPAEEEPS